MVSSVGTTSILPIANRSPARAIPLQNAYSDRVDQYDTISVHTVISNQNEQSVQNGAISPRGYGYGSLAGAAPSDSADSQMELSRAARRVDESHPTPEPTYLDPHGKVTRHVLLRRDIVERARSIGREGSLGTSGSVPPQSSGAPKPAQSLAGTARPQAGASVGPERTEADVPSAPRTISPSEDNTSDIATSSRTGTADQRDALAVENELLARKIKELERDIDRRDAAEHFGERRNADDSAAGKARVLRFASTPGGMVSSLRKELPSGVPRSSSLQGSLGREGSLQAAPPMPSLWTHPPKVEKGHRGPSDEYPDAASTAVPMARHAAARYSSDASSESKSASSTMTGAGAGDLSRGTYFVPPPRNHKWCKAHGASFSMHGRHLFGAHQGTCACCRNECPVCDHVSERDLPEQTARHNARYDSDDGSQPEQTAEHHARHSFGGAGPPSPDVAPKWLVTTAMRDASASAGRAMHEADRMRGARGTST